MQQATQRKNRIWHIVLPVMLALTTLLIWSFSLTPAKASSEQSGFVRELLLWLLGNGAFAEAFLTLIPVRKLAHFTEYFVLGAEWKLYSRIAEKKRIWLCGLLTAVIDECLQFFSPGRAPAVKDVLIDTAGFLCGCLLIWAVFTLCRKRKK